MDYNVLSLDDARKLCGKFHYVVVNSATNKPLWLCESGEDARKIIEQYQPYCWMLFKIIDLRK